MKFSSHPTWVRGLKQIRAHYGFNAVQSHPTWVRGLKQGQSGQIIGQGMSHPTWVRGLKPDRVLASAQNIRRTLRGCVD